MKITVTLSNSAGPIAEESFDVRPSAHDSDETINIRSSRIIEGWVLSVGDTITIREGK